MSDHLSRRAALGAVAVFLGATRAIARSRRGASPADGIHVDVSALRANDGDLIANWVEEELPAALDRSFSGRMPPSPVYVRIDYLTLGPNTGNTVHANSSPDNIVGVAFVRGAQIPVRATTNYDASPIDQTMIEQSNHDRVSRLVQGLAYWLPSEIEQGGVF